jgi:hypothetical protein
MGRDEPANILSNFSETRKDVSSFAPIRKINGQPEMHRLPNATQVKTRAKNSVVGKTKM